MNLVEVAIELTCDNCGELKPQFYRIRDTDILCLACAERVFPAVQKEDLKQLKIEYIDTEQRDQLN